MLAPNNSNLDFFFKSIIMSEGTNILIKTNVKFNPEIFAERSKTLKDVIRLQF